MMPEIPELEATTSQELDPTGRVTAFYCTMVIAAAGVVAAVTLTIGTYRNGQLSSPVLGALALLVLVAAMVSVVVMATPRGAVLTHRRFQCFYAVLVVAALLSALSQWGTDRFASDNWGPICLGLGLMISGPQRAEREIVGYTGVGVIVAAVLSIGQVLTSNTSSAGAIVIVVAVTPVLGLGLGAAAYSRSLVAGLRRVRTVEVAERRRRDEELLKRILAEDSVGQLGELRSEVVPFFERLSTRGYLYERDTMHAARLSAGLRLAIVQRISDDPLSRLVADYSDFGQVSHSLTDRHRAALRAIIEVAAEAPGVDPTSFALAFRRAPSGAEGEFRFVGGDAHELRTRLAPLVRMLGFVVGHARLTSRVGAETTVRFTFGTP